MIGNTSKSTALHTHPRLFTGVPSIDEEHAQLFAQFEALSTAVEASLDSAIFSEILSQLGSQINTHFHNEERLFKSFAMPEGVVSGHIQDHVAIPEQYAQLNIDLMHGKRLDHSVVLQMIKGWIIGHVVRHDLLIKDYRPMRFVLTDRTMPTNDREPASLIGQRSEEARTQEKTP